MTYKNSFPFENKSTLHFICTVMDCYVHIFQILSYLCAITIQISQSFLHFNLECVHMLPTRLMVAGQKPSSLRAYPPAPGIQVSRARSDCKLLMLFA